MDLDELGVFPVVFDMSKTTVVNLGGPGSEIFLCKGFTQATPTNPF